MNKIIERYQRRGKDLGLTNKSVQEDKQVINYITLHRLMIYRPCHTNLLIALQAAKEYSFSMAKRIDFLEVSKRCCLMLNLHENFL